MKEFDELGLFWLPGHEEDALSGRLQFDPKEGGINLSLVGGFDNAPDHGDSSKLRILGWRGNDRVTLDQCLSLRTNRRAPGVPESRYYANQMFVGHYFEEEELSLQSASLRLSDLDSWVGRSGIAVEDDSFWLGCALRAASFRCRGRACGISIRGIDPPVRRKGWYARVDGEAAVAAGYGMDVAGVGVGHGANDGQAESCPLVAADGCASLGGGESAEGFEQARDLVGRHRGAGVFHGELGVSVIEAAGDRDPSVFGDVVSDGVVDEVDRTVRAEAFFAAGEGEQAVDEALVALVDGEQGGAELTQRFRRVGVVEGDFDERAVDGQRGAELVGGIGDESALAVEGALLAVEGAVEPL